MRSIDIKKVKHKFFKQCGFDRDTHLLLKYLMNFQEKSGSEKNDRKANRKRT